MCVDAHAVSTEDRRDLGGANRTSIDPEPSFRRVSCIRYFYPRSILSSTFYRMQISTLTGALSLDCVLAKSIAAIG